MLNTSSYLCNGGSLLRKIVWFCPVWALLPCGCRKNSCAGSDFECRDHLYPCKRICAQAYLRYRGAPSPVVVWSHFFLVSWLLLGSANSHFQLVNWDSTLMPAGSHATAANQLRAQEWPTHKHTNRYTYGWGWVGGSVGAVGGGNSFCH